MDINQTKREIARLELEAAEAQKRFVELMGNLSDGGATIDEARKAFRESGQLQLEAFDLKLQLVGDALQTAGITGVTGLMDSMGIHIPLVG